MVGCARRSTPRVASSHKRITNLLLVAVFNVILVAGSSVGEIIDEKSKKIVIADDSKDKNNNGFFTLPLIPHHVVKERRRRELHERGEEQRSRGAEARRREEDVTAQHVGSLYQGYGTHYLDLWCGTPPQRQTLIVDTGSSVTAFPCDGCNDCGELEYHIDDLFLQDQSSTFEQVPCDQCTRGHCSTYQSSGCAIGVSYQEGSSWNAFEAKDYCYVTGPHSAPLQAHPPSGDDDSDNDETDSNTSKDDNTNTSSDENKDLDPMLAYSLLRFKTMFGCQISLTGLFITQLADGIMGMDDANESYWRQMHAIGKMKNKIFSLCFTRAPHVDRGGTEAGAITFGGVDPRMHNTPLVYAKYTTSGGFYAVKPRKIYLRSGGSGKSVSTSNPHAKIKQVDISQSDLNSGRTIVDSGTTDTYFTRKLAYPMQQLWKEMYGKEYSQQPIRLTSGQLDQYPTILIQLEGNIELNQKVATDASRNSDSTPGLVGPDLDPQHPYDVLIAIPPTHYMEYDEDIGKYVNRFYMDESSGSVIGANAMMGHDVVFDVESSNVGWAESDCNYFELIAQNGYKDMNFATNYGGSSSASHKSSQNDIDGSETERTFDSTGIVVGETELTEENILIGALFLLGMLVVVSVTYRHRICPGRENVAFENVPQLSEVELQGGFDHNTHVKSTTTTASDMATEIVPNGSALPTTGLTNGNDISQATAAERLAEVERMRGLLSAEEYKMKRNEILSCFLR